MTTPPRSVGSIAESSFCEVLSDLCRGKVTGVLELCGNGPEKAVYLKDGNVVFASSRDPDDRLGELLLTRAVIRREQLERASTQVGAGKRLGTVLVEMGFLPASDLPRWVREQVKEILYSLFSWTGGEYRFKPGPYSSDEAITLRISTAEIFLTGLRRVQKWSVLRKGAGEVHVPYRLAPHYRERLKEMTLGSEEHRLLGLLEAHPVTMEEAAVESGLSPLLVGQVFFALRVLEVAVPAPAKVPPGPDGDSAEGAMTVMMKLPLPAEAADGPALSVAPAAAVAATPGTAAPSVTPTPRPPTPVPKIEPDARMESVVTSGGASPAAGKDAPGAEASDSHPAVLRPAMRRKNPPAPPEAPGTTVPPPRPEVSNASPAGAAPNAMAAAPPAAEGAPARRRPEYRVIRVEAEKLSSEAGVHPLEEVLRTWSQKGFRLAGVVPGGATGLFGSPAPSYFIFTRD